MPSTPCLPRETLKRYLSGCIDQSQSDSIESHLQQCPECEQTIEALERDPDTLVDCIRDKKLAINCEQPGEPPVAAPPVDPAVSYVLERVKRAIPAPDAGESHLHGHPSRTELGPYQLLRPLGHGGMGSVYLARHRKLQKLVAVKLLPARPFRDDCYAARFQREILAAGQLSHPAIVSATDAGEVDSTHYLVMEYVEGLDLSRVTRLVGPLEVADACAILHSVALGLSHAHAAGIVHRDIKPSNLMLSHTGEVKVLDFGLAQVGRWDELSAELTTVGQLMGTLDYMAPEQAERADAVDYRADLYSLGATLFRLLCGRPPLAAAPDLSPLERLRLLASQDPPRLDTMRMDAPEPLVDLAASLLARDPGDRPASAAHVAQRLQPLAAGADLVALIRRAEAGDAPSAEGSIPPAWRAALRLVSAQDNSRRSNRRRWWLAAVALPLLVAAGILITLQLDKGQLVIDSTAKVEVELLRDGELYERLRIEPGANTTRLYAGNYRILLDAGSDAVELDQPQIEIRRGETVVARVQNVPHQPRSPSATSETTTTTTTDELTYNGKTLSQWLDQFSRERSSERISEALGAISALVTDATRERVTESILETLPQLWTSTKQDTEAFEVLEKAQESSRAFYALLADELEASDGSWARRILATLPAVTDRVNGRDVEPLVAWTEKNVLPEPKRPELVEPAANWYRSLVIDARQEPLDAELEKRVLDALTKTAELGPEFWLSAVPGHKKGFQSQERPNDFIAWNPGYADAVETKAIEAIAARDTGPQQLILAAGMLQLLRSPRYDRSGMNSPDNLDRLTSEIARRLRETASRNEPAPWITLYSSSRNFSLPSRSRTVSNERLLGILWPRLESLHVRFGDSLPATYELLSVAETYNLGSQLEEPLLEFASSLIPDVAAVGSNPENFNHVGPSESRQVSGPMLEQGWMNLLLFEAAFRLLPENEQEQLASELERAMQPKWADWQLQSADANGDGVLNPSEAEQLSIDPRAADLDDDGSITLEELLEYHRNHAREIVSQWDSDKDGMLTQNEWDEMATSPQGMDFDKDGRITVEEITRSHLRDFRMRGGQRPRWP